MTDEFEAAEIECVDCGCDLSECDLSDREIVRCDTCENHYHEICGEDCPVICDVCRDHHFFHPNPCAS